MEPGAELWSGIGEGISRADGWMVVLAVSVVAVTIGVVWLWARHIRPSRERVEMRELDIREHEARNDEERIRANSALAEQMAALRASNEQIAAQNASVIGRFDESASHSREMGSKVDRIDDTTQHTEGMVKDIHRLMMGGVGKEGK